MRRKHLKMTCLFLSALLLLLITTAAATDKNYTSIAIMHYEYPVVPGTDEWDNLETFSARLAACRIPQETLEAMTTDALVDAVLDFPFLLNLLAYNSVSEGFDCVVSQSDALKELLTRSDGPDRFAEKYITLTTSYGTKSAVDSKHTMTKEEFLPTLMEIILGQPEIYNAMTRDYRIATGVAETAYNGEVLSYFDVAISENESEILREESIAVETPNGSSVSWVDYTYLTQWTSAEKTYLNNSVTNTYNIISIVRDPNRYYNCHSYAWYSTSASNTVWIPDPSIYMTDGSYAEQNLATSSCKVFINNDGTETSAIDGSILGDHSGIAYSVSGRTVYITSKWGQLGLYKHNMASSPYSGDHTDYSYWR